MSKDSFKSRGFSEQKLALLARLLEKEGASKAPRLKRIPSENELPLSFGQMGLWLFDQVEPGSAAYNFPVRHDFKGHFDVGAFEWSMSEVVRRHEVLRSYYLKADGRPVQRIAPPVPLRLPVVDLQALPEAAREHALAGLTSRDAQQPFDLEKAPLIRARLLKLAPDEHVLLLNFHHIAFDGGRTECSAKSWRRCMTLFSREERPRPCLSWPFSMLISLPGNDSGCREKFCRRK